MKRYLLFCMESYYPSGGWDDFCGDFDSIEEAKERMRAQQHTDYWHVVDCTTKEQVAHGRCS